MELTLIPRTSATGDEQRGGEAPGARGSVSRLAAIVTDRLESVPPWVLIIQLFIGLGWVRAGVEKAIEASWWTGEELERFLGQHQDVTVPWYQPFIEFVVAPNTVMIAVIVMTMQFVIGAAMLAGWRMSLAIGAGMFLNLHFVAAGAVNPSVFYLLAQGAVLLWMAERSGKASLSDGLKVLVALGLGLAAVSAPFTATLVPAEVIDDPALILATVGSLTALGSYLTIRQRNTSALAPSRPREASTLKGS